MNVVLDKGTLDALNSDIDRAQMLGECLAALKCNGVLISISFSSVHRLRWLESFCAENDLWFHVHVVNRNAPINFETDESEDVPRPCKATESKSNQTKNSKVTKHKKLFAYFSKLVV